MSDPDPLPNAQNLAFIETLYADYLKDPRSVPETWRNYFAETTSPDGFSRPGPSFAFNSIFNPPGGSAPAESVDNAALQQRVDRLIRNYRVRGHMLSKIDPLDRVENDPPELSPGYYDIREGDMDRSVSPDSIPGMGELTLREIVERLKNTYTRSIGVQFMHIDDLAVRKWLQRRMEASENRLDLSRDMQLRILTKLTDATIFEEFIQKKYVGAKSFSLEGAESLIPLLDLAIEKAGSHGIKEIVLGMAHRGRLNVLANIMGKDPRQIFREFEDKDPEVYMGRGDVKYHLGYSTDWLTQSGQKVHLSLTFNPSHLEFVNTVALGRVRAKQDRAGDRARETGMAVLIHGDAAFAGEGTIQETLNLSRLEGYRTGGTLHIVVNNQLGFTTSPQQGRSTYYATDIAKMLQSPIFHVNGEDPEAVAQVVELAMDFRKEFQRDVVIDMYGYRLHGHNEGDEPSFTQPQMYQAIKRRESVYKSYSERLLKLGKISREEVDRVAALRREQLESELSEARRDDYEISYQAFQGVWSGYVGGADQEVERVVTGVAEQRLSELLLKQTQLPDDFKPLSKIKRLLAQRAEMAAGERPLDWSTAEALALASLAAEGYRVRISGQDSERGTFSQRHSVLHDTESGETFMPLAHLEPDQAPVDIYNSPLSETGVLGFEYGYSLDCPDGLVAWEAQYGDFANAAQVIIDQFIASAEDKWRRLSGLVMLLPHGFEGSGPEHSSARLERYLQLCAEDNMQIAYPTTPAQYFHMLRRQVLRTYRKPLVVMTPKSLLRHPQVLSGLDELATGGFQRIIPDKQVDPERVSRVLLCSGKVYYDLLAERNEKGHSDIAILRLEQLYPLHAGDLQKALASFPADVPVVWVQEEPENMGAWWFLRVRFGSHLLGHPFSGVYREASASPATGSSSSHKIEQMQIVGAAFAPDLELNVVRG